MWDSGSSTEENKADKSNHTANQPSIFKLPSSSSASSSNIPSRPRSSCDGDSDWNTAIASNKSHRPPSSRPQSASMLTTRRPSLSGAVYSSSQVGLRKRSASYHGMLCNAALSLPREMRSNVVPGYSLYPQNVSCDNKILSAIENSLQQQKEDLKKYFDEKFSKLQKDLVCMNKKVSVLQEYWGRFSPFGNSSDVISSEVSSYHRTSPGGESVTPSDSPKPHQSITRKSQESVQSTSPTQVSEAIRKVSSRIAVQSPLLTTMSGKVRLHQ